MRFRAKRSKYSSFRLLISRSFPLACWRLRGGADGRQAGTGGGHYSGGVEPLDRSTIWPFEGGEPGAFYYQRYAHPTGVAAERALGELEGGEALLFPSGSGAIAALVLGLVEPGQTIALAEGAYYGTALLFRALERWGLRFTEFDQTGPPPDGVDLVWLEAPSNPFLTMPDFEAAAAAPARVVVGSTAATPINLRPLEHGADFVVHSITKYLGGHSDVLL